MIQVQEVLLLSILLLLFAVICNLLLSKKDCRVTSINSSASEEKNEEDVMNLVYEGLAFIVRNGGE